MSKKRTIGKMLAIALIAALFVVAGPAEKVDAQGCNTQTASWSHWTEGRNLYGIQVKRSRSFLHSPTSCAHKAAAETASGADVDWIWRAAGNYSQTPWTSPSNYWFLEPPFLL